MIPILLIGAGGHCKSVMDSITSAGVYQIAAIIDVPEKVGTHVMGYQIVGTESDLIHWFDKGIRNCSITVGSIGDSSVRERIFKKAMEVGYSFPVIKDKSAIVSDYSTIGMGSFIGKGAIINANAIIGDNTIINTGAIVEHDCCVGDFSHIAPGVTISGNVKVGKQSHIGVNATVIQGIKIGNKVVIGAGSVVVNNIKNNCLAYGNPCRIIK